MNYEDKMQSIYEYISQHLEDDLSLDNISNYAGISKYHFHRLFSGYVGRSLASYIQLQRLKRASYRLAFNKEFKIIDIALEARYESHEVFTRAFKKYFAVTPKEFRENPNWEKWHELYKENIFIGEKMMEVKVENFNETKIAVLEYQGRPELLNTKIPQFIAWRKATAFSPVNTCRTFGIAYNDPKNCAPEEFKFDICGEIKNSILPNDFGVIQKSIPGGKCAVIRHLGSRDNMEKPIYYLYRTWLPQSEYELRDFPLYFEYLNLYPETPENELITDIYLPIK